MITKPLHLGVNIDHVATLRQVRGTSYPRPVEAAVMAEHAGADSITVHLREDRRHIQDDDLTKILGVMRTHMNLEMAVTDEMLGIAERLKPSDVCLVPEKREELTTEGGLDVAGQQDKVRDACARLADAGIRVSLFIDPDPQQIDAAAAVGAPVIELHTGAYAAIEGSASRRWHWPYGQCGPRAALWQRHADRTHRTDRGAQHRPCDHSEGRVRRPDGGSQRYEEPDEQGARELDYALLLFRH